MWYRLLAALTLGALFPLAFAPLEWSYLAIFIPCGLIFLWEYSKSWFETLVTGFAFGFTFFSVGVYWIYYSIYTYGHSPLWLAYFIMLLLCAVLALFFATLGLLLRWIKIPASLRWIGLYPSLWIFLEGIRAIIGSGFPWLSLGYSQTNSPLSGFAPFIGVYGLSWLCVCMSGLLFIAYQRKRIIFIAPIVLVYGLGLASQSIHWGQDKPPALSVALVQGNVKQDIKWDPWQLSNNIEHYLDLTAPYWQSRLIVWPEAAIPANVGEVKPALDFITSTLNTHHSHLLTGIDDQDEQGQSYNALILLGQNTGLYYKRHLVPFGEYLPLQRWLAILLDYWQLPNASLSAGPIDPTYLTVNGIHFAPFICYEIIFPGLVRQSLPKADVLVTISDDSWFGDSFALTQHLQMAQMRSLEMARPQLFVGNSGITAIINAQGKIDSRLPIDEAAVLSGYITPHQGMTPFMVYGTWPVWLLSFILSLIALIWTRFNNKDSG